MIPTEEEYNKAKEIVDLYEQHVEFMFQVDVGLFERDLKQYLASNKVDGCIIKEFRLETHTSSRSVEIIPVIPDLEECYDGKNDTDIQNLARKHNIRAGFIYWCYPK